MISSLLEPETTPMSFPRSLSALSTGTASGKGTAASPSSASTFSESSAILRVSSGVPPPYTSSRPRLTYSESLEGSNSSPLAARIAFRTAMTLGLESNRVLSKSNR